MNIQPPNHTNTRTCIRTTEVPKYRSRLSRENAEGSGGGFFFDFFFLGGGGGGRSSACSIPHSMEEKAPDM